MQAIDYKIKGIKCDNPDCDFRDETVEYKDYKNWLNKPCPKCGSNLLTQKDLETIKAIIKLVKIINWITKPFMSLFKDSKRIKVSAEMNGSGKVYFKRIE